MTTDKIAWAGELELVEAKWTDKDGHTIRFRLVTPNENRPNPFKAFTKRRGKRAGTRFIASLSHVQGVKTEEIAYNGEFMLAGWGDTSTAGYTVTFWCEPPEQGIHSFAGYLRGRDTFMAALVELDEDDMPVDQAKRARVEGGEQADSPNADHGPTRKGPKPLSNYAALLCTNEDFWRWINVEMMDGPAGYDWINSTEQAAAWMRERLEIESRRELDEDEKAAERYHRLVRRPFTEWNDEGSDTRPH